MGPSTWAPQQRAAAVPQPCCRRACRLLAATRKLVASFDATQFRQGGAPAPGKPTCSNASLPQPRLPHPVPRLGEAGVGRHDGANRGTAPAPHRCSGPAKASFLRCAACGRAQMASIRLIAGWYCSIGAGRLMPEPAARAFAPSPPPPLLMPQLIEACASHALGTRPANLQVINWIKHTSRMIQTSSKNTCRCKWAASFKLKNAMQHHDDNIMHGL